MTTMCDIEDMWKNRKISDISRRLCLKYITHCIRILVIYFVCRYFFFIPKTLKYSKT